MVARTPGGRSGRRKAIAALAMAWAWAHGPVAAQGVERGGRPLRIVVPAPAGGPADMLARAVARRLAEQRNVNAFVENKPGGASIPAAVEVMRAPPDGQTLFLGLNTTHTQVPHLFAKAPFDPLRDFTPITQLYTSSSVLVAHPSVEAKDLAELVARARGEPMSFASASVGTSGHLYIEMLNQQRGTRFVHVPYKGSADASRDLLSGTVPLLFDSPTTAIQQVKAGRLKALAVTGGVRLATLPTVATAREQGFPELEIVNWMGVFGPAQMPPALVERLNADFVAVVRSPEIREQFEALGAQITGTSAAEFAAIVRADHDSWGRLIRSINLKLD